MLACDMALYACLFLNVRGYEEAHNINVPIVHHKLFDSCSYFGQLLKYQLSPLDS